MTMTIILLILEIYLIFIMFLYNSFDMKKSDLTHNKKMEDMKRKHEEEMEKLYPTWQEGMLLSCEVDNWHCVNTKQITAMISSMNEELTEKELEWAKKHIIFDVEKGKKAKIYNLTDNEYYYIFYRCSDHDLGAKTTIFLNSTCVILNVKNNHYSDSNFLKIKEVIK